MKDKKTLKEAMLTIYQWAKENNIDYFSFAALPFGHRNKVTNKVTPTTDIRMTYTVKDAEKWEKGHEGVIIKNDYYKEIIVELEGVE